MSRDLSMRIAKFTAAVCRLLILSIVFVQHPTRADAVNTGCRTYLSVQEAPGALKSLLISEKGQAIQQCSGDTIYFASMVSRGPLGVCHYSRRRIFESEASKSAHPWTWSPPQGMESLRQPQHFMAPPSNTCGTQSDPSYISVGQLSEGVFLGIIQLWQRMTSTQNALEDVLRGVKSCSDPGTKCAEIAKDRSQNSLQILAIGNTYEREDSMMLFNMVIAGNKTYWEFNVDLQGPAFRVVDIKLALR